MPQTGDTTTAELVGKLVQRSYITYQSRIKASERLATLNALWNVALVFGSVAVTINSVVLLVDRNALGPKGDVAMACASILTLFVSVSVSGMNLSGKSRDMFTSYRRIQRLSAEAERVAANQPTQQDLARLSSEYDDMLDNSDNHRLCDYLKVEPSKRKKCWEGRSDLIALLFPVTLIILSAALAAPAVLWMFA